MGFKQLKNAVATMCSKGSASVFQLVLLVGVAMLAG